MRAERTGRGPGKPHKIRCPHPTARLPLQTKEKLVDGAGLEPAATGLKGRGTKPIGVIRIRQRGCRVEGRKDRSKIALMRRASETDVLQGDGRAAGHVLNIRGGDRAGTGLKSGGWTGPNPIHWPQRRAGTSNKAPQLRYGSSEVANRARWWRPRHRPTPARDHTRQPGYRLSSSAGARHGHSRRHPSSARCWPNAVLTEVQGIDFAACCLACSSSESSRVVKGQLWIHDLQPQVAAAPEPAPR